MAESETNEHFYVSTACFHGLHDDCRLLCKWCDGRCNCGCHQPMCEGPDESEVTDG